MFKVEQLICLANQWIHDHIGQEALDFTNHEQVTRTVLDRIFGISIFGVVELLGYTHLVEEPVLEGPENLRVHLLGKLAEKPAVCALGRHLVPPEYRLENLVIPQPVTVDITACPCPDAQPKGGDDISGIISPVGAGLWQVKGAQILLYPGPVEKSFIRLMPPKGVTGLSEYSIGRLTILVKVDHAKNRGF